jgi:hypothetical protein
VPVGQVLRLEDSHGASREEEEAAAGAGAEAAGGVAAERRGVRGALGRDTWLLRGTSSDGGWTSGEERKR